MKVIISGGGTGGHIFPAISIANAIREREPGAAILFVGALGKMEMEKVPAAGYDIVGLPVAGFQRRLTFKNVTFIFKLIASMMKANRVVTMFRPDVVIGVGGYASGPVLRVATRKGIPTLIQEQNSFPGVTNRILAPRVSKICVAYDGMAKYFPASKIILTGNPVRQGLMKESSRAEAAAEFDLDPNRKTVLVLGGSLGARSINEGMLAGIQQFLDSEFQVIWQTGKYYFEEMKMAMPLEARHRIRVMDFVQRMDYAYQLADVVVSRAGASSISEIAILAKAAIFVPSPNVSEDHQTKNAMALVERDAAVLVPDARSREIATVAIELLRDENRLLTIRRNVLQFARPEASKTIANEVFKLIQLKR
ncbi:UDP-N-acetylglucosamine-N-acetylmuramylpentapeptide N-acetylglucosamine transferase [Breznakibacter xylanolyticus]|uniref:UDP-N-acetylglucosamine--N-acetylmuramyl-(pentapeptide) pyrophosphoryl-undecaprenol N-acetylglucosamine transferase n=1 Tax=Breznakibacter xylanolyticus TaxID=990 RepID=A0A2W7NM88_9BACT|nr:undecaprenyldiphospho-muramoylpentapeptide beta-N-acetylglucosaminyltransferase [Breznakibacter xylanolyticus]PZX12422.1 UDP-N-acetylglucosamine-N-acetylmuramylpentapeptide N-acetylglucosamine transferase [Breznakibacter xylanolyticus]